MTQSDKKALEEFEELTKIPCTCHDDFKQRKLKDPSCFGCLHGEECKNACAKILQEARNEERQRIVEIVKDFHSRNILNKDVDRVCTDLITALTEQK